MEYRTEEQFISIAEDCNVGNWDHAAQDCVKYGFYAHDLSDFDSEFSNDLRNKVSASLKSPASQV